MAGDTPTNKKLFSYLRTQARESNIGSSSNNTPLTNYNTDLIDINSINENEIRFNKDVLKTGLLLNYNSNSNSFIDDQFEQSIEFQGDINDLMMNESLEKNNKKETMEKKVINNNLLIDNIKKDSKEVPSGILITNILENGRIIFKEYNNKGSLYKKEINKGNNQTIRITTLKKILKIPIKTFKEYNFSKFKNIKKIAEATYSEVYLIDNKIYKIIPFKLSDEKSFHREVYLIKELSKYKNTPNFYDAFILKGKFDKILVKKFEEFKQIKESINDHPLTYKCNFGIIIMEDCGIDLESYNIKKEQVKIFFNQLINQLYILEKELEFEHRDLHWGNIMIKNINDNNIIVKIIDFTLSRFKNKLGILYMDLKNELDIFECNYSDEQYTIYPQMKFLNKNNWKDFTPITNLLWLKYLINKIEFKVGSLDILIKLREECQNCLNISSLKFKLDKSGFFN